MMIFSQIKGGMRVGTCSRVSSRMARKTSSMQRKTSRAVASWLGLAVTGVFLADFNAFAAAPTVSNVRSAQRAGTKLVDIYYDLADPDSPTLNVRVAVSTNGGAS